MNELDHDCTGRWIRALAVLAWTTLLAVPTGTRANTLDEMADLSLEDLLNVEVVSVSKKKEKVQSAAAAVWVVTQEDITRSGATSIPDALRAVPGLTVLRIDSNKWAVSARGFNGLYANKLLVLVDGRSVYSPLFGGVYWDAMDTVMEDVERIEVIRGPGGTLWGANAVNGVINIITKSSRDTSGSLASVLVGDEVVGGAAAGRHGGLISDRASYRVYGKYYERGTHERPLVTDTIDDWQRFSGGLRFDWQSTDRDKVFLQGDLHHGEAHRDFVVFDPTSAQNELREFAGDLTGGNVLVRWSHRSDGRWGFDVQSYFDRTTRETGTHREETNIFDLELQQSLRLGSNDLAFGLAYRSVDELLEPVSPTFSVPEAERRTDLMSVFVQDELSLRDESLRLIAGAKLEHNDFTGAEFQPNLRLAWDPSSRQTVWAAVSRAVSTPSRYGNDLRINIGTQDNPLSPIPVLQAVIPAEDLDSEKLLATELGYRLNFLGHVALDAATFLNRYDDLVGLSVLPPVTEMFLGAPHTLIGQTWANGGTGWTYGGEVAVDVVDLGPMRRLQVGYSVLLKSLTYTESVTAFYRDDGDPSHTAFANTSVRLAPRVELGVFTRYTSGFERLAHTASSFDPTSLITYVRGATHVNADVHLNWRPVPRLGLSLIAQNLIKEGHYEFTDVTFGSPGSPSRRVVALRSTWSF